MKPKIYILFFLLQAMALQTALAQAPEMIPPDTPAVHTKDTLEKNFVKVDEEAGFPGGETAWRRFLEQNLNPAVPANNRAPAGTYTVLIQFVVAKDGSLFDIKALTNHGYGMETEVIRILRKSPRWSPAMLDGKPLNAYRKQPVTFLVEEEKKRRKRSKDEI